MTKTCAIYTRKSTDERLDMEFNTLDAQREACEAYITSQRSEGWAVSDTHYNDGGFSGGNMERPALTQLLEDIKAGKVDIIVVYKIDRLTRSLSDFAKLVDIFDEHGVTFVSITQSFNTTTSMGRLTLNVLLSFAQFEREVTSERIRDKIVASKAKGMWQGGRPPFGFDIGDRRLVINREDAPQARRIFELYLELDSVSDVETELKRLRIKSRKRKSDKGFTYGGAYFSRGALYNLLQNPVYIGKISHKGKIHEGLHDAIISQELWDDVQNKLKEQAQCPKGQIGVKHRNLLTGRLFDEHGNRYTPVYTNHKNKQKYRYYLNKELSKDKSHPRFKRARFPAHEIEKVVEDTLRNNLCKLILDKDNSCFKYFIENQKALPTYDLVRSLISKVIVQENSLQLHIQPKKLETIACAHLDISLESSEDELVIEEPFKSERSDDGAVIISSKNRDIFDLPPKLLKKLVQGVIWRDEHFDGISIKAIARREGCSHDYVSSAIFKSFEVLQNAS